MLPVIQGLLSHVDTTQHRLSSLLLSDLFVSFTFSFLYWPEYCHDVFEPKSRCLLVPDEFVCLGFCKPTFRHKSVRCVVVLQLFQLTPLHMISNRWLLAYEQLLNPSLEWSLVEIQRF